MGRDSGFVWDADGHVVTNAHVVAGASRAFVRLPGGRATVAELIGMDPSHDLAVLRIETDGLTPLPLGDSAELLVGQKVFAIGNPFGLDFTLTTGVVSALERELPSNGVVIRGLVQTDAAINPGNSGGPLLDSAGRLIGVNTAIYSPSGASAGIGFAVPVDAVVRVVPQLIASGRYAPPVLGISTDARADAFLRALGVPEGVAVVAVRPDGPAARAGVAGARMVPGGFEPGDVIVSFDDARIRTPADLRAALDIRAAGDEIRLGLWRDGETREIGVVLAPAS